MLGLSSFSFCWELLILVLASYEVIEGHTS
jgi:hypothetical protein